jgi:hypothetical protein
MTFLKAGKKQLIVIAMNNDTVKLITPGIKK